MTQHWKSRLINLTTAVAVFAGVAGCARGPRPVVNDYDSYQTVALGAARYTLPEGYTTVGTGRGHVLHGLTAHPDVSIRVEIDTNPPRDIKFDADAEKRRFLDEINGSFLRSAQYSTQPRRVGETLIDQRWVKVFAEGQGKDGEPVSGTLLLIREGASTATIRVVGPKDKRHEMNRIIERLGRTMQFGEGA